ncbi:casein kinase ii subunit beta [Plasmopara halstedii]|uniref:Casein kinase II subunit beta n=1 Tax=Plasmopara halstedii TaxID=4781 RepID=A0A0N7L7M9_PLAHL|nr:casein kinase ii subunit beta [Plasmopara halstedii]CEG47523.1 casein kinase ii subunit beta [Plasmopara halstedii]|eukprot:XP_024583892.1 casein kinase ii subunit beta [Plasmopara halstedii]
MSQPVIGGQATEEAKLERLFGHMEDLRVSESALESVSVSEDEDDDEDSSALDEDEDNDVEGSEEEETSWITWFCSLRENSFLCEVDENYIEDDFNLTGLSSIVPYYDYALDIILDIETPNDSSLTQIQQEMIESAAEMLYGLIHARYILTTKGMAAMLDKYQAVDFGRCHRVYCQGQPVLPVGRSDVPRHTTVNVFCPKCRDIFFPKSQRAGQIDGAYFGATFPHVFLMTHTQLVVQPPTQAYVPRVFGYKIHKSSEYYTGKKKSSSGREREKYRKVMTLIDRLKGRPNDEQQAR